MDEKELDQQLGDLGDEECEKLDEQMWGSDDEEQTTEVIFLPLFELFHPGEHQVIWMGHCSDLCCAAN